MQIIFRVHTLQRMFERGIHLEDVRQVLEMGEIIEQHPPICGYSNRLMLGWCGKRPVHMVVAFKDGEPLMEDTFVKEQASAITKNQLSDSSAIIVTVYQPDPARWSGDYCTRLAGEDE